MELLLAAGRSAGSGVDLARGLRQKRTRDVMLPEVVRGEDVASASAKHS
ncbi:hypothetical protein [Nocardia tengchongensis]